MTIELQHKIGKKVSPDIKKSQLSIHHSQFTKKVLAFTLAETLIVIGIIGIVSALTLPNLNSSTGDKEKIAKLQKLYQNLNDALGRAEAAYGPIGVWTVNDDCSSGYNPCSKRIGERLTEFMKISKTCGMDAGNGCFKSGMSKRLNGQFYQDYDNNRYSYKVITADGISLYINCSKIQCGFDVDIDGPNKGVYTLGKDVFMFKCTSDKKVYPYGESENFSTILSNLKPSGAAYYAAAWIISYDNMDYLKLDSNGKCPNGTTPTESNPRCK